MSSAASTLSSEASESQQLTAVGQLPLSLVNTLVSTGNLGDKKADAQDIRKAVREKTFSVAKFVQLGDPVVIAYVGDVVRKELKYSEEDWMGVSANIMKQVVAETNKKRNNVATDLKKHLFEGESIVCIASNTHAFYSFLIHIACSVSQHILLVVRKNDEDCPLRWDNDEGLQELVGLKRENAGVYTWFVDNCLKHINKTAYNKFVKTGIMKPSEVFTKSDEGLIISLLINGYPRWRVKVCHSVHETAYNYMLIW